MERTNLGEFEEVVLLTVAVLGDDAYGISIREDMLERLGREVSMGALRTALKRLESKGYLDSEFGEPTAVRGGKRKRYYRITSAGRQAAENAMDARKRLWNAIPHTSLDFKFI